MEDNNLWLRHLLNLVVQVTLALYVFWKSIGRLDSVVLLASGVLVFVAGIVKYVERIWCLKCGSFTAGLESRNMTPRDTDVDPGSYAESVIEALARIAYFIRIFGSSIHPSLVTRHGVGRDGMDQEVKSMRLSIGLMYEELYTKAPLLRSRRFMIFRHISQISAVVAFVLFQLSTKQQGGYYAKADVAVTYSLFLGGFFLEVCSVLNSMASPWTWKRLKDGKWVRLARLSWSILSSGMGWPEKKQRWPCSVGQYNYLSWLTNSDRQPRTRRTFSQRVMAVVRRVFVDVMGVDKKKIFWMSKMLDTWHIEADQAMIVEYIASEIHDLYEEHSHFTPTREWPNLGLPLLFKLHRELEDNFGRAIVIMHGVTELHLRRYPSPSDMAAGADDAAFCTAQTICRKLSNYMMYLLVANPSMLPLTISSVGVLGSRYGHNEEMESLEKDLRPRKETVEEMVHMWTRLLLYAAGMSRPEMHASQLATTGGELITLAWLLTFTHKLVDYRPQRVRLIKQPLVYEGGGNDVYAFNIEHALSAGSSD